MFPRRAGIGLSFTLPPTAKVRQREADCPSIMSSLVSCRELGSTQVQALQAQAQPQRETHRALVTQRDVGEMQIRELERLSCTGVHENLM